MLENHLFSEHQDEKQSWCINDFMDSRSAKSRVIRKFINSAIYVEQPIQEMAPLRKTSPIDTNSSDEGYSSCKNNNIHSPKLQKSKTHLQLSCNTEMTSNYSNSDTGSQVTVKIVDKLESNPKNDEMKLSLTCLSTVRTCHIDDIEKEEMIKNWIAKKDTEMRKKKELEAKKKIEKEKERQMVLNKERENFKRWLAKKKQEEEIRKREKEKEEKEKELKELEKEKKNLENEVSYNLWLRRKKKEDLERKIREKLSLIQIYEEKQKRLEDNEKAYQEWFENSKNRPKPIPLNQGLQSLCSSLSVTYINPVPWKPNIELLEKPASQ